MFTNNFDSAHRLANRRHLRAFTEIRAFESHSDYSLFLEIFFAQEPLSNKR